MEVFITGVYTSLGPGGFMMTVRGFIGADKMNSFTFTCDFDGQIDIINGGLDETDANFVLDYLIDLGLAPNSARAYGIYTGDFEPGELLDHRTGLPVGRSHGGTVFDKINQPIQILDPVDWEADDDH